MREPEQDRGRGAVLESQPWPLGSAELKTCALLDNTQTLRRKSEMEKFQDKGARTKVEVNGIRVVDHLKKANNVGMPSLL